MITKEKEVPYVYDIIESRSIVRNMNMKGSIVIVLLKKGLLKDISEDKDAQLQIVCTKENITIAVTVTVENIKSISWDICSLVTSVK